MSLTSAKYPPPRGKLVVYLAHPVAASSVSGVLDNLARAKRWLWALRQATDWSVIAPWIPSIEAALDAGATESDERARGLADCVAVVKLVDGVVLCGGRVSSGMQMERDHARHAFDLTALGDEPPDIEAIREALFPHGGTL